MSCFSRQIRLLLKTLILALTAFSLPIAAAPLPKPIVFVTVAKLKQLSEVLTYPARVEPRIKAAVVSEADGVVTKVIAPLGQAVKAGASLMIIRNTDPVYDYAPMVVLSPVSGIVSRVDVSEGARVARGDKLVLVTEPTQVRVVVEIPAQDVRSIYRGQVAELTLPGQKGGSETGPEANDRNGVLLKVKGLSPFVDPLTGTASCELEVASGKQNFKNLPPAGAIARVTFQVNIHKGFAVPDSAITYRGKTPYVRLIKSGKASLAAVSLGRKQAGIVEILKGLKNGDQVVERTSGFVAEGEQVEVQQAAAAADNVHL